MSDLKRLLKSIGKRCFIEYFEQFKNCQDKEQLAKELLQKNTNAKSLRAQTTRINRAKDIFKRNLEYKALELIISSKKLNYATIEKAKEILNQKARLFKN